MMSGLEVATVTFEFEWNNVVSLDFVGHDIPTASSGSYLRGFITFGIPERWQGTDRGRPCTDVTQQASLYYASRAVPAALHERVRQLNPAVRLIL